MRRKKRYTCFRTLQSATWMQSENVMVRVSIVSVVERNSDVETVYSGLVILESLYGPLERDEAAEGLDLDVTVALQALVNRSQLYIPGRRSKVSSVHSTVVSHNGTLRCCAQGHGGGARQACLPSRRNLLRPINATALGGGGGCLAV